MNELNNNTTNQEQNSSNQNATQAVNKNHGNFIPILIIVSVILAGGIYAYFKVQEAAYPGPSKVKIKSPKHFNKGGINYNNDPYLQMPESTSSDPDVIENDLDVTNLDAIEQDLQVLEQI